MRTEAISNIPKLTSFERMHQARDILQTEGHTLLSLADRIDVRFCQATEEIHNCQGSIIVTGMGKAGLIGQKIAATMASTGTRSHFLHPAEAVHGDLGRVAHNDLVLILSHSGETDEVIRLLPTLAELKVVIIAITGKAGSRLAKSADVTLDLGPVQEAGLLGLAPSTSTTAMLALGDAIALVTSQMRQFGATDFARFHPGGSLGRRLAKVAEIMRPLTACRMALQSKTVRHVMVDQGRPGRRSGAILIVNEQGKLTGIFTDSDLARLLESGADHLLDNPISEVMTPSPATITRDQSIETAVAVLAERKFSELPVTSEDGAPLGLLDITDVVGLLPRSCSPPTSKPAQNECQDRATIPIVEKSKERTVHDE